VPVRVRYARIGVKKILGANPNAAKQDRRPRTREARAASDLFRSLVRSGEARAASDLFRSLVRSELRIAPDALTARDVDEDEEEN
jgi:hypothetical protein